MLDNIAKTSYRALVLSQGPTESSHISSHNVNTMVTDGSRTKSTSNCPLELPHTSTNNVSTATPVRRSKRSLVVPNAPKISRMRTMTAPQLSAARRNIFNFLLNEE